MDDLNTFALMADAATEAASHIAPRRGRKPRQKKSEDASDAHAANGTAVVDDMALTPTAIDPAGASNATAHAPTSEDTVAQTVNEEVFANESANEPTPSDAGHPGEDIHQRIGHLTRTLHDALRELGYDKDLAATREHLPDARDRLSYIARVTGEAADKVLNAVDRARVVQESLTNKADGLRKRWQAVAAYTAGAEDRATPAGRSLIDDTCGFFSDIGGQADATNSILTDIMMAQDFHDLTGQVIRKVVTLATNLEEQLLKLLLQTTPPEQLKKAEVSLEGPVVNADGRTDVVTDQSQVDDLLASLGF
ncbi:MAG TPA: protein phosphatase CheZ [Burkholderiaceae bacterium]|nr:protein phosphatase CheZ [Burkholderiaceae bacterium]